MKKLLILSALLIFACSSDSEGNPCIYEPTLSTEAVTDITETSATLNGIIAIVSENCDVPNNAEQGFVYSTEIQPTLEDTQVNVNGTNISTTIEGLEPNTTYYVRSFLTNNLGDFYGNEIDFTTEELSGCNETGTVTDQDGNSYDYLCYGEQVWTVENAEMVNYRDGTPIPQVTYATEWSNLTTGAWCYYDNDPTKPILYNGYAVVGIHDDDPNTPNKKFAPAGWHVPSDNEWTTLEEHLIANGYNYDGTTTENKIAKSMASTTGWNTLSILGTIGNNQSSNNSSGFNTLPVGYRSDYNGNFTGEGERAMFWTSTPNNSASITYYWMRDLHYTSDYLWRGVGTANWGFSVRLVKD